MYTDVILESMQLDPLSSLYNDPSTFMLEDVDLNNEYEVAFTESTTGVTKGNVFSKLWTLVKKLFKIISKGIQNMIRWVTNLFRRKGKNKSIDDILNGIGVKTNYNNKTGKTTLVIDPRSTYADASNIEAITKPFFINMNADGKKVFITKKDAKNAFLSPVKDEVANALTGKRMGADTKGNGMVKGTGVTAHFDRCYHVINLINNKELVNKLNMIADTITGDKKDEANMKEALSSLKSLEKVITNVNEKKFEINLDSLLEFQKVVNQLFNKFNAVSTPDNSEFKNDKETVEVLNEFVNFINEIQMGMNILSSSLKSIYIIDKDWMESINDIETLGKFVDACLENGIPPKFIALNATLVASPKLKGEADHNKPIWGQTRLVFFPHSGKTIYKIAISEMGVISNKAEADIWNKIKNNDKSIVFAATPNHSKNYSVIEMERVSTKTPSKEDIKKVREAASELMKELKIPLKINDLHFRNIGYRGDQPVILDYGISNRDVV